MNSESSNQPVHLPDQDILCLSMYFAVFLNTLMLVVFSDSFYKGDSISPQKHVVEYIRISVISY